MSYRYASVTLSFPLDEKRVDRLSDAGIHSLRDLKKTLAALDLGCKVELFALPIEEIKEIEPREGAGVVS